MLRMHVHQSARFTDLQLVRAAPSPDDTQSVPNAVVTGASRSQVCKGTPFYLPVGLQFTWFLFGSYSLNVRSFEEPDAAHLLWFLVQALEMPLPEPFSWVARCKLSAPDKLYLIMSTVAGANFETADHPHLIELRKVGEEELRKVRAQLAANGGRYDFSSPTAMGARGLDDLDFTPRETNRSEFSESEGALAR